MAPGGSPEPITHSEQLEHVRDRGYLSPISTYFFASGEVSVMKNKRLMGAIEELLKRKPKLDQLDISSHLGISLELAINLCAELLKQRRISKGC